MNTTTDKKIVRRTSTTAGQMQSVNTPGSILFAKALQTETRKLAASNRGNVGLRQVEELEMTSRFALTPSGPLARMFSWFRTHVGAAPAKQLRLAETVQLGDKRFVAIIHVDGRKFLIGGGTSGVNLLTQLDEPAA